MNRLAGEKSAYLKHAAHQKIDWYPWSDAAFEKARQEDKPVFLSTGAIWCHWCHVMAKECFEDEEIAKILNEDFISVKLDRDERPDIDRRYQRAVAAMGHSTGWPLSVFLTHDKKPFFGGTYFPPTDSHGRPGFNKVLKAVSNYYRSHSAEVSDYTARLAEFLAPKPEKTGEINKSMIDDATAAVLSEFDPQNGGFGSAPKFPMPGAIGFLLNRYYFTRKEPIEYALRKTLVSMAKGGVHDHIGGGFHRYSVDEGWIVPHFEKMADDNSWLLRNYADAYSIFGDEYFRTVAEDIIGFTGEVLSAPGGGFYASQDADVTPDDEGGYFTWTDEDFRNVLTDEEYRVLSLHLLHEKGSMHHDESKTVLFIAMDEKEIAEKTGIGLERVAGIIAAGKKKLHAERNRRKPPFVDRTIYTSLNGMFISSYLYAFRTLKIERLKDFALKSLDKILKSRYVDKELFHSEGVKAVLDDYVHLIDALTGAYEVTGKSSYLALADELMKLCMEKFRDRDSGGFFDTETEVLGVRLKAVEDIPHPSANAVGIMQLIKLFNMTGKDEYDRCAEISLKTFSEMTKGMGIHAGYYFCSLDAYFNMLRLDLETAPGSELAETALSSFNPYKSITYAEDRGCVTPCLNGVCLDPICSPDRLRDFLKKPS